MQATRPRRKPYEVVRESNPLGLTERELQAVAALVAHGSDKKVALALGVTTSNAARLLVSAQRRMNVTSRVQAALKYDRMRRGGAWITNTNSSTAQSGGHHG